MAATGAFVAPALGVGVPLLIRNTGSSMPRGKLAKSPEWHWRRLDGSERLAQVIDGVHFRDGEPVSGGRGPGRRLIPNTKIDHSPFPTERRRI